MSTFVRSAAPRLLLCLALAGSSVGHCARPPPLSIDALRGKHFSATLEFVRKLDETTDYTAYLVSYRSAGLAVYAMVAVPRSKAPPDGFPILVANHGTHPNPPRYGITPAGVDSRPGDYYRSIPALYARQGFLVVMPDYRGHNISEGLEFTGGFLASGYYSEDVLALLAGLPSLQNADLHNVFMWGHSLGGEVSLRVLLATELIKGASLWSTVGGDIWDQAYFYSRYEKPNAVDSDQTRKPPFDGLREEISRLGAPYDWQSREPLRYLGFLQAPLIIHEAIADSGVNHQWSELLAKELYLAGKPYIFHTYPGDNHFPEGAMRQQAVDRDVAFFRCLIAQKRCTAPPT